MWVLGGDGGLGACYGWRLASVMAGSTIKTLENE